ncbi:hypothetical protein P3T76_000973 [Phytophthora citrophthora]|uniref:FAM194 C-terminal domain-containing protein n=1 Tax=Phytophthora citrophthora TaxID=4793 RepID=A0AAD9GZ92_9STRA|nr:hypothetical protein P3T76_000973 [Phytophthora citrophthora]
MVMSTAELAQCYPAGGEAVRLDDFGCGFCYYESGRVAVCANKINDYQRSFQFYEDNKSRTLLATLNEHAVGSAGRPGGKKMILTKESGIILDGQDVILKTWRWNPKAQSAGSPPSEPVTISLNDSLIFTYRDRSSISIKFAPCPGILVDFACGECFRRTDSYLDRARRVTEGPHRGKLVIEQEVPTLLQRHKQIELESLEKRSKSKPRSKDLAHSQIKQIVSTLETKFDRYEGCRVTPAADGNWREKAHLQSLREIPVLRATGFEVGQVPTLFGSVVQANDASESLKRLKNESNGKWLGSVEIHQMITQENPGLPRTGSLTNASGRYSQEIQIAGGGTKSVGERLTTVRGSNLDSFLREKCSNDELVVVACLRADDRQSRATESMLEQVQLILSERNRDPLTSATTENKCRLVKCNLAESPALAERYRIRAVPTFLTFYDSRLVNVSSFGGLALRVAPTTKNANLSGKMDHLPRVLLVEKAANQQLAIENVLRREGFQWDLASSGEQAVSHFTRQPSSGVVGNSGPTHGYELVMLSDSLTDSEVRALDRFVGSKQRLKRKGGRRVLICVVISAAGVDIPFSTAVCQACRRAQGRRVSQELAASAERRAREPPVMACPHCSLVSESSANSTLLPPVLAEIAQTIVYRQVKAATLHRLAEKWAVDEVQDGSSSAPQSRCGPRRSEETHWGLTPVSFFSEVDKQLAAAKGGAFLPDHHKPEMALSAKDTVLCHQLGRLAEGVGARSASA